MEAKLANGCRLSACSGRTAGKWLASRDRTAANTAVATGLRRDERGLAPASGFPHAGGADFVSSGAGSLAWLPVSGDSGAVALPSRSPPFGNPAAGSRSATASAGAVSPMTGTGSGGSDVATVPPCGGASPDSTSPGSTSPGAASPGARSPGSTSPGSTSPGSTSPGAASPSEVSPGGVSPGELSPRGARLANGCLLSACSGRTAGKWLAIRDRTAANTAVATGLRRDERGVVPASGFPHAGGADFASSGAGSLASPPLSGDSVAVAPLSRSPPFGNSVSGSSEGAGAAASPPAAGSPLASGTGARVGWPWFVVAGCSAAALCSWAVQPFWVSRLRGSEEGDASLDSARAAVRR